MALYRIKQSAFYSFLLGLMLTSVLAADLSAQVRFQLVAPTFNVLAPAFCLEEGPGASHSISIGNSWAGATGKMEAGAKYRCSGCTSSSTSARAFFNAKVTAKLLRRSIKAFDAQASASVQNGTPTARLYLKIGRNVLINKTAPTISFKRTKKITLIRASYRFTVGPVPMKVSGQLAAVLDANLKLEGKPGESVVRAGHLSASLQGSADGSVDIAVAGAGVEAELNVLKAKLTGTYRVEGCGASGELKVCFEPVEILLKAFAKINKPCFPKFWKNCPSKYSKTIVRWRKSPYCKTLIKI